MISIWDKVTAQHYIFGALVVGFSLACTQLCYLELIKGSLFYSILVYVSWQVSTYLYVFSFFPKPRVSSNGKAVLITGCDSGFGFLSAQKMADLGYLVFAGCLMPQGDGAKKLSSAYTSDQLVVVGLDVTNQDSVNQCKIVVEQKLQSVRKRHKKGGLWAVVNNAGIMSLFEVEFGEMNLFEKQMHVNCLGLVRVTKAFLPLIRMNNFGAGRVVNVASLAGRFTLPGFVAYSMSKAPVITFCDGLRREMSKWNIDIVSIEPHLYRTNLVNKERLTKEYEQTWKDTPEDIRQSYGRKYFDAFMRTMDMMMDTSRDSVGQVVNCLAEAVSLEHVQPYYQVMKPWENIRIWFYQNLAPTFLIDCMLSKYLTDINGVPAQLAKSGRK